MTPLFDKDTATDPLYNQLASPSNEHALKAKLLAEKMWECCREYIDPNAEQAKTVDFYPIWWELYLAYALTKAGISLIPNSQRPQRDKGFPDLLATKPLIWIEAVMPEPGIGPDALKEPSERVFTVNADPFILRLSTALASKTTKLRKYIEDRIIQPDEATIIALSGGRLPLRFLDYPIPNIVRALYGVGDITLEIGVQSGKVLDRGVKYRDNVRKQSQALVGTDLFLRPENSHVSAVLYSSADCVNFPSDPGADFLLIHNPYANVPLLSEWLKVGDQFWKDGELIQRGQAVLGPPNR